MPEKKLICKQVSHRGYVVPGSIKDKCSQCGELVWISPSSLLLLHDNPGVEIVCSECLPPTLIEIMEPPYPAQVDEFKEYFRQRPPVS